MKKRVLPGNWQVIHVRTLMVQMHAINRHLQKFAGACCCIGSDCKFTGGNCFYSGMIEIFL
jgi:hypothetical protein